MIPASTSLAVISTPAFAAAGLRVSVKRFGFDGFVPAAKSRAYYPSILDALSYAAEHKLLFRCEKRAD